MFERMMSEIRHRLRALFRRADVERELDDELAFHVERETAKLVEQGISPAEARRSARLAFGGVDRIKDASRDVRGTRVLDVVNQDLRHALRQIAVDPGFSGIVVLTLALGIGANAALFTVIDHLFFRDPVAVEAPDKLLRLYRHQPPTDRTDGWVTGGFAYPAVRNIAEALPDGYEVATYSSAPRKLGRGEAASPVRTVVFGPGYFQLLGVRPLLGRLPSPDEERIDNGAAIAMISHAEWMSRYGGDRDVIGRQVELLYQPYTILGVLPRGFSGVDVTAVGYWVPYGAAMAASSDPYHSSWNYGGGDVLVRLPPGAGDDSRQLTEQIANGVVVRGAPDWMQGTRVSAAPLHAAYGPQPQRAELGVATRLAAVAVILLLIACANVANLNLARAARRRQEIAVRLSLGISRTRLVTLLTTETLLLSLIAAAAAMLVALWGGTLLRATLFPDIEWLGSAFDVRVAFFALAIGLAAGLLTGLPSALRAGRFSLTTALKAGRRDGLSNRSRLRTSLVAVQSGLSVILLIAAGAFVVSLRSAAAIDVGFDIHRLATVSIAFDDSENHDADLKAVMPRVIERLQFLPGVVAVAASNWRPLAEHAQGRMFDEAGTELEFEREAPSYQIVTPDFFDTMGMQMLAGRVFGDHERDPDAPLIVVNDAMAADLWPDQNPIGRCVRLFAPDGICMRVTGVIETAHRDRLIEPDPIPHFYRSLRQLADPIPRVAVVRAEEGQLPNVISEARAQIRQELPAGSFPDVRPLDEHFMTELRPWRLGATLFSVLGILALLVAVIGTYSVISYLVHQRRHELGVRMALGARAAQIARLVMAESVRMVGIGVAIGVAAAFALAGLIESLLYETSAREPVIMVTVVVLLVLAAGAAALVPAWRAARVHPAEALRSE